MKDKLDKFDFINLGIALVLAIVVAITVPIDEMPPVEETIEEQTTTEQQDTIETSTTIEAETETVKEVTVQETLPQEPRYYCEWLGFEFSQRDFEMLCRLTYCEAGNQPLETQTMVCLTVLNRLDNSDKFADTIKGVLYQHNAYEVTTWSDFESREWTEQVETAVHNALKENNHPRDMYYFRTLHYHTFGQPYMISGDLWFSTEN